MAGKVCDCGHTLSWHRLIKQVRLSCSFPGCDCQRYVQAGGTITVRVYGESAPTRTTMQPVISTEPASVVNAFAHAARQHGVEASAVGHFMLDMAAKALAHHRLNKLSGQSMLGIAKMAKDCHTCRTLVKENVELGRSYPKVTVTWASTTHMSIWHVASIFNVDQDMLRSRALELIQEALGEGSDDADSDDQLEEFLFGWRSWRLTWDNRLQKLRLVPPAAASQARADEPIVTKRTAATHQGDVNLCLEHLTSRRTESSVNPADLTVTIKRHGCTCGLYCYTRLSEFEDSGYLSYQQVTANVMPYGIVQMGADQETLRASNMKISRLIVWLGKTEVDESSPYFGVVSAPAAWRRWMPQVDIQLEVYSRLCQELATQFEVQVDLATGISWQLGIEGEEQERKVDVVRTFLPVTNPLEGWK